MGWKPKEEKPKEGYIYFTKLPIEDSKLNSFMGNPTGDKEHPVIPISNNLDGTTNVIGCTSKKNDYLGDIKIETTPAMDKETFARLADGERVIKDEDLKERKRRKVNNE